jgi:hypothetical protein
MGKIGMHTSRNVAISGAIAVAAFAALTLGSVNAAAATLPDGTTEGITFEGLIKGINHVQLTDYDGFTWSQAGVVGKKWALKNGYGPDEGFLNDAHGKAVGYTLDQNGSSDAKFTSDSGTFSLHSGHFASAWIHEGESVTFTAYRGDTSQFLRFGRNFAHIDAVEITASSGTDSDSEVVMDNMKVVFDTPRN